MVVIDSVLLFPPLDHVSNPPHQEFEAAIAAKLRTAILAAEALKVVGAGAAGAAGAVGDGEDSVAILAKTI
jgi:hypothetical protein